MTSPAYAISQALKRLGYHLQREQAAIIGEQLQAWNAHLNGHRSPRTDKVRGWLVAARAVGVDLAVECRAVDGWEAWDPSEVSDE